MYIFCLFQIQCARQDYRLNAQYIDIKLHPFDANILGIEPIGKTRLYIVLSSTLNLKQTTYINIYVIVPNFLVQCSINIACALSYSL
jgi:hypothetical protein